MESAGSCNLARGRGPEVFRIRTIAVTAISSSLIQVQVQIGICFRHVRTLASIQESLPPPLLIVREALPLALIIVSELGMHSETWNLWYTFLGSAAHPDAGRTLGMAGMSQGGLTCVPLGTRISTDDTRSETAPHHKGVQRWDAEQYSRLQNRMQSRAARFRARDRCRPIRRALRGPSTLWVFSYGSLATPCDPRARNLAARDCILFCKRL